MPNNQETTMVLPDATVTPCPTCEALYRRYKDEGLDHFSYEMYQRTGHFPIHRTNPSMTPVFKTTVVVDEDLMYQMGESNGYPAVILGPVALEIQDKHAAKMLAEQLLRVAVSTT